jgi:ubiquinone biosynthesis protein
LPIRNLHRAKEDIVRALRAWGARTFVRQLPYSEKSVNKTWQELSSVYFHYKCTFEWQILRVHRALNTLDASLMHLYPEANYTALGRRYFRQAQRRGLLSLTTRRSRNRYWQTWRLPPRCRKKPASLRSLTPGWCASRRR